MIEGLQYDVSSEELKRRLLDAAQRFEKRAQLHEQRAELMAKLVKLPEEVAKTYSNAQDPREQALEFARTWRRKAVRAGWRADHVAPNETYRLKEHELDELIGWPGQDGSEA